MEPVSLAGEGGAGAGFATIQRSRRCGGRLLLVGLDTGMGTCVFAGAGSVG